MNGDEKGENVSNYIKSKLEMNKVVIVEANGKIVILISREYHIFLLKIQL